MKPLNNLQEMNTPESLNSESLTDAEQAALDIIKNERGIVKVLSNTDADFIHDQIADPNKNRPSKSLHFYDTGASLGVFSMNRPTSVVKINPKTFETHEHVFGQCHETVHIPGSLYTYTKKTATTIIPSDPQYMSLFTDAGHIALLWDMNACDLKDGRYLYPGDGDTDWCTWLDIREKLDRDNPDPYISSRETVESIKTDSYHSSMDEIVSDNRNAVANQKRIPWNECLVGLPAGKVDAVVHIVDSDWTQPDFGPQLITDFSDAPPARLETWDFMLYVKKKLNYTVDIPVLVISDKTPVRAYTANDRNNDLKATSPNHFRLFKHPTTDSIAKGQLQESLSKGFVGYSK